LLFDWSIHISGFELLCLLPLFFFFCTALAGFPVDLVNSFVCFQVIDFESENLVSVKIIGPGEQIIN